MIYKVINASSNSFSVYPSTYTPGTTIINKVEYDRLSGMSIPKRLVLRAETSEQVLPQFEKESEVEKPAKESAALRVKRLKELKAARAKANENQNKDSVNDDNTE